MVTSPIQSAFERTAPSDGSVNIQHFVSGQLSSGKSGGRSGEVFNPATGKLSGRVAFASREEVDAAVRAAHDAYPAWAGTPPLRRARVMFSSASSSSATWTGSPPSSRPSTARCFPTPRAKSSAVWKSWNSPAASRSC